MLNFTTNTHGFLTFTFSFQNHPNLLGSTYRPGTKQGTRVSLSSTGRSSILSTKNSYETYRVRFTLSTRTEVWKKSMKKSVRSY